MPYDLLWFLLPVAAASGWWVARRQRRHTEQPRRAIPSDYYKGINYFLNEQPDKAIDVFIQMLEVDSDSVEPHLALGNLFRRRGETERAIRIHQNLIARPNLDKAQRDQSLLELGHDYMQAGLFDRAETLLEELVERDQGNLPALRLLLKIYEQEQEWTNAINVARKLDAGSNEQLRNVIAQYYCELAEEAIKNGDFSDGRRMLKRSLASHSGCARAWILQAAMAEQLGNYRAVIKSCRRLLQQQPDYLADVITMLMRAYRHYGRTQEFETFIEPVIAAQSAIHPVLVYTTYLTENRGHEVAGEYLEEYLNEHPSLQGLQRSLTLKQRQVSEGLRSEEGSASAAYSTCLQGYRRALDVIARLVENDPLYICKNCGFPGSRRRWQCPGCHLWETITPVTGDATERDNKLGKVIHD
jgi:lipopolysaccharide biosynthesis regulator YciM